MTDSKLSSICMRKPRCPSGHSAEAASAAAAADAPPAAAPPALLAPPPPRLLLPLVLAGPLERPVPSTVLLVSLVPLEEAAPLEPRLRKSCAATGSSSETAALYASAASVSMPRGLGTRTRIWAKAGEQEQHGSANALKQQNSEKQLGC